MAEIAYQRMVIATDEMLQDRKVMTQGAILAEHLQCDTHLVYVLDPIPLDMVGIAHGAQPAVLPDTEQLEARRQDQAREKLAATARRAKLPEATVHVTSGPVADAILNYAEQIEADLIVLGTHGRSGLRRILGSTASAVVHRADCDVLVVRLSESSAAD